MNPNIFKAYDIRGRYGAEINEPVVAEIGKSLSRFFKGGKIILGHDARVSSPGLYRALAATLKKAGAKKIILSGMMTSPMLYFLVNRLKAQGGVMVTASHLPKEYNGLKVVGRRAVPISGTDILSKIQNANIKVKNDNSK